MSMVDVPPPEICAPICVRKSHKSAISRLFRRVFDACCPPRQCRRHQDILRRADAGKIKVDIAAAQFSAQGDEPRRLLDVRAEGFHALQVQVNRTLTNCAATGSATRA